MERVGKLLASSGIVAGGGLKLEGRGDLAVRSIQARQDGAGRARGLARVVATGV